MKIKSKNPTDLAMYLINEHPQTIAVVIALLDKSISDAVLKLLPESLVVTVLSRLKEIDTVPLDSVTDIIQILNQEVVEREVVRLNYVNENFEELVIRFNEQMGKKPIKDTLSKSEVDALLEAVNDG